LTFENQSRARFLALVAYAVGLYFIVVSVGRAGVTVTALGNAADGTVYKIVWTVTQGTSEAVEGAARISVTVTPSGGSLAFKSDVTYSWPGYNMKLYPIEGSNPPDSGKTIDQAGKVYSVTAYHTVPAGTNCWFWNAWKPWQGSDAASGSHNEGPWNVVLDTTLGGTAGTYTGEGSSGYEPPSLKQISWKIPANLSDNPITWAVIANADGAMVGGLVAAAGAGEQTLTAANLLADAEAGDYTLKFWIDDAKLEGGQWVSVVGGSTGLADVPVSGEETVFTAATGTASAANVVNTGTTPAPATTIAVTAPTVLPAGKIVAPGTGGAIWTGGGGTGGVSDAVFKEGVDKLLSQGVGDAKVSTGVLSAKASGDSAYAGAGSAGGAAKSQAEGLYGSRPTGLGYTLSSSGEPSLSVTMPIAFGGATFDLNPFQSDRLKSVTDWFRVGMIWLTLATLGVWIWTQLAEWTRGLSTIQQAKGNAVIGGTGAQATALVAAGLITAAVVVATTALLGWAFGSINVPALVATVTENPVATMAAGAFWMLDQVFPVATMIAALVARMTFQMFSATLFAGVAAVIRFVVP